MFQIEERLKGLPATREQVLILHQSLNFPNVGIPGRNPGPARAFVVGLKGREGTTLFVYLHLHASSECAIYVSEHRNLSPSEMGEDELEALGFVESMGFLMEDLHFGDLSAEAQDELIRTLPLFQREPKGPGPSPGPGRSMEAKKPPSMLLGRLLSAF